MNDLDVIKRAYELVSESVIKAAGAHKFIAALEVLDAVYTRLQNEKANDQENRKDSSKEG